MGQVRISLDPETHGELLKVAKVRGVSVSVAAAEIVKRALEAKVGR